ncbi:MAG: YceI family protein [Balneolales bacterium]|nr:YceI family protein [Balneolales bacterium]
MQQVLKLTFLLSFLLSAGLVFAQSAQEVTLDRNTTMYVDGTSTLHDWTVESKSATGVLVMQEDGIASVSVQVPVRSLESGKSGMDRRMYDALESRNHDTITFTSNEITLADDNRSGVAKGQLTIAGQTRDHEVPFTLTGEGNSWKFTGSSEFTMSKFDIDPPTAVMGTIRTGDEIVVRFEIATRKPQFTSAQ